METQTNDSLRLTAYPPPGRNGPSAYVDAEASPESCLTDDSFALHSHAGANLRRHMWKAARRVSVLLLTDLSAFLVLRTALRAARAWHYVGTDQGTFIRWLFAQGYLGGWQYAVALVLGLVVTRNYGAGDDRRSPRRLFAACALATALPMWSELWNGSLVLGASRYVLTVLSIFAVLLIVRLVVDWLVVVCRPNPSNAGLARAILVGHAGECEDMQGSRSSVRRSGLCVLGYVDVMDPPGNGALGSIADLERVLVEQHADTIILCGTHDDDTVVRLVRLATTAECEVLTVARRFRLAGVRPSIIWRHGYPFMTLRPVGLRWQQLMLKRLLDVVLSAVALILLSPLMLAVAIAVFIESPGPIIFRQRRLSRHGRSFVCYKFRSMHDDAEERLRSDTDLLELYVQSDFKLPEYSDTRITRVGRFLRRTSLDELPQLWNVLKGDMSLVGPRPIVPAEIRHYRGEAPLFLTLKPGLTGAWQVGGRSNLQYPERAAVELEYIERWTLLGDVGILARTLPVVLGQRGAH